jgi:hypothetical protein
MNKNVIQSNSFLQVILKPSKIFIVFWHLILLKRKTNTVNNFDTPDAHFDFSSLVGDAQVEKVGNPKTKWKLKELFDENQTKCHKTELNPSKDRAMPEGDNPSFLDKFTKFTFFLHSSIHIRILYLKAYL